MSDKHNMVFPEYLKDFSCIGPGCSDSCCVGWKVSLDKKTYDLYDNLQTDDEELRAVLDEKVLKKEVNAKQKAKTNNYGYIKMRVSGACPFLSKEKLCLIHKNIGEEYLSPTCMVYPRTYRRINNVIEYSAVLSCPEVTRRALLNPDGIKLVSEELEMPEKAIFLLDKKYDHKNAKNYFLKYFFDVQSIAISLVQCREFTLEQRLMLLAMFVDKTDKVILSGTGSLEGICDAFSQLDTLKDYCTAFKKLDKKTQAQMQRMRYILNQFILNKNGNMLNFVRTYVVDILDSVFDIQIKDFSTYTERVNPEIAARFEEKGPALWDAFMAENSYIIENFLVSLMFCLSFPWNSAWENDRKKGVMYSGMFLITQYALLKLILTGQMMAGKELTEEFLLEFFQKFYRIINHNDINRIMIAFLQDNDVNSLAGALLMVNV